MPLYQQGGLTSSKGTLQGLPQIVQSYLQQKAMAYKQRMLQQQMAEEQRRFNLTNTLNQTTADATKTLRQIQLERLRKGDKTYTFDDLLGAGLPEGMELTGGELVGDGRVKNPRIGRKYVEPKVHSPQYVRNHLGALESGTLEIGGMGIEMLVTPEDHIDYAMRKFGPDWITEQPRAAEIINKKFPGAVTIPKPEPKPEPDTGKPKGSSLKFTPVDELPHIGEYYNSLPPEIQMKVLKALTMGRSPKDIIDALKKDGVITDEAKMQEWGNKWLEPESQPSQPPSVRRWGRGHGASGKW